MPMRSGLRPAAYHVHWPEGKGSPAKHTPAAQETEPAEPRPYARWWCLWDLEWRAERWVDADAVTGTVASMVIADSSSAPALARLAIPMR